MILEKNMTNLPHYIIRIIKNYVIFKPKNKEALQKALQGISKYKNISNWDVYQVTDMRCMFVSINFNADISNWDICSVTDMNCMFAYSSFNGDISNWDVSSVTDMNGIFNNSQFNGDVSKWDVHQVTDSATASVCDVCARGYPCHANGGTSGCAICVKGLHSANTSVNDHTCTACGAAHNAWYNMHYISFDDWKYFYNDFILKGGFDFTQG